MKRVNHHDECKHQQDLARAMNFVCEDARWAGLIAPDLRNADARSRLVIVKLYEQATGTVLMRHLDAAQIACDFSDCITESPA